MAKASTTNAKTKQQRKDLPKINLVIPGCERVNNSKAALGMIAELTVLLMEVATYRWRSPDDSEGLSVELGKLLVNTCDPKRECKMCKAGKGLGPGVKDEQRV